MRPCTWNKRILCYKYKMACRPYVYHWGYLTGIYPFSNAFDDQIPTGKIALKFCYCRDACHISKRPKHPISRVRYFTRSYDKTSYRILKRGPTRISNNISRVVCVGWNYITHYGDVIMGAIASQITSLTIVYSTVYSDADQRKHQSSASLAFLQGIHRGPVNSPHKWPVTRKMFPFDDVIMHSQTFLVWLSDFIPHITMEANLSTLALNLVHGSQRNPSYGVSFQRVRQLSERYSL